MALGMTEILVIAGLAIFLFGSKKVIDWVRSLAKVKKAYNEELNQEKKE